MIKDCLFPKILGCDGKRFAVVQFFPKRAHICFVGNFDVPEDVKRLDKAAYFTTGALPQEALLFREVDLPPNLSPRRRKQAALYLSESILPYPMEETHLACVKLDEAKKSASHALFCCKSEDVQSTLSCYEKEGFFLDSLLPVPYALQSFNQQLPLCAAERIFLHFEESGISGVAFSANKLRFSHFLPLTQNQDPSFELRRFLLALEGEATSKEKAAPLFFATGDENVKKRLQHYLENLPSPISPPPCPYENFSPELWAEYAVPIGLALGAFHSEARVPEMRWGRFASPRPWRILKKPVALFACSAIAITLAVAGFCQLVEKRYEKSIQAYADKIVALQKNMLPQQLLIQEPHPLKRSLEERLALLKKQSKAVDIFSFPLAPSSLSLTEFLVWIAQNPIAFPKSGTALQLQKIHYSMDSRPVKKNPKERYRIRLNLDFTTQNARQARDFHQALLAADFISRKEELQWAARGDTYSASFFLKDFTAYP